MKKILSMLLLILLVNCSTPTNINKDEQKPSINNVIEGIKSLPLPKL
jgi:PBP1b-binding outer membrane lipoprotein LpoB